MNNIFKKVSSVLVAVFTVACLYFMSKGKVGIVAAYGLIGFNIIRVLLEIIVAKKITEKLKISDGMKEEIPRKTAHILLCLITIPMVYYSFKCTIHSIIFPIIGLCIMFAAFKTGFVDKYISRNDHDETLCKSLYGIVIGFIINCSISILYPQYTIGALLGVVTLGLGDPMACFIGKNIGKHKFKNGKSIEGFIGFIIAAIITMYLFTHITIWKLLILAIAGAITELYSGDYDNCLIQIIVALLAVFII